MIEYVSGSESHTSNWGKFYVKGLEKFVAKEDHPRNERDKHAFYQCYAGEVPDNTVFTIFEQSGDKRGTDTFCFWICQANSAQPEQTIESSYGSGTITGKFSIIAGANSKVKAPRLMAWWDARPTNVNPASYARHLAEYIDRRGVKEVPPMNLDGVKLESPLHATRTNRHLDIAAS